MKKSIVLLLCGLTVFSATACDDSSSHSDETSEAAETICNIVENDNFYIGDFETKRQCIEIGISRSMKKVMNNDKTYVTRGEHSLRFELWPHEYDNFGGEITFDPSKSSYFTELDFSGYTFFCFDLYVEKGVSYCKLRPRSSGTDYEYVIDGLTAGWNHIKFPLSEFVYTSGEKAGESFLDTIDRININFPAADYVQVYYIDNVRYKAEA